MGPLAFSYYTISAPISLPLPRRRPLPLHLPLPLPLHPPLPLPPPIPILLPIKSNLALGHIAAGRPVIGRHNLGEILVRDWLPPVHLIHTSGGVCGQVGDAQVDILFVERYHEHMLA